MLLTIVNVCYIEEAHVVPPRDCKRSIHAAAICDVWASRWLDVVRDMRLGMQIGMTDALALTIMVNMLQGKQEPADSSPPRRRGAAAGSTDSSPPRRSQAAAGAAAAAGQKAAVMQSGASAGLVRGQELKEQLLRKQQVILRFCLL